jgi:putative Mg2+ transporter-C (MgtC) family protein
LVWNASTGSVLPVYGPTCAAKAKQKEVLRQLEQALDEARYPTGDLVVRPFGSNEVEIAAVLTATSVVGDELDQLTRRLAEQDFISQAFWSPSTTE